MNFYFPMFYYGTGYFEYLLFMLPALVLVLAAQGLVRSRYKKYSRVNTANGVTGRDIAQAILNQNGITNVSIAPVGGNMTDHYHPTKQVIYLSEGVYDSTSIAAVGIAAHEAGHAVQHAKGYAFLQFRSAMVPVCNVASALSLPLLFAGYFFDLFGLVILGIALFGASTLFHLITLPVEFNASARALKYIQSGNLFSQQEYKGAKQVLTAAALTYVAALAQSLVQLLYYILRFAGGRRR